MDALWVRAGVVLAAWFLLLLAENVVIAIAFKTEFAGSWETRATRRLVIPIAFGALAPAAFVVGVIAGLADRRVVLGALGATAGAVTAWGVSYGRHFASLGARLPFVALVAGVAGALVWWLAPTAARAARERPRAVALLGAVASAAAWSADERVLPRLYPAFHAALFALTLGFGALIALAVRPEPRDPTRAPAVVAGISLALAAIAILYAPSAARAIAPSENLRFLLVEHAPIEGRAVRLASLLAPPAADDAADSSAPASPGELPRALDWTGRDVVLVTVDALRADHVSAYGYSRLTTPSIDAVTRSGARFDAAYCPTPHTSYSIASLMTGKYMRPLVALGLGDDSDTWAGLLRRYGYRTAAFYPPAVFFIDGERFRALHERGLDFEYRKEEFATPTLRAKQVGEYLASVPADKPLFLWVHFFEPHEPYVAHAEHPFGTTDVDRYDSEIAAADEGIGAILQEVRASRPGAVILVTADHGEEFGEHGGRYHGTTVYEEQVRVPLIVEGPGVSPGPIASVVQTIDLLPTVLSALGIPRPARLRGRDLGPLLARKPGADDPGLAFAETDEYTLLARGDARLVCARRIGACSLFDRATDPGEAHDVSGHRVQEARELRRALTAIASDHGRLEHGEEAAWPEALRRGIAGDADAADDVAALLDDASAPVREEAARVSFDLHAPAVAAAMKRVLGETPGDGGEDERVRRWCALALVRMGEAPGPAAEALLRDRDPTWRRVASLAFAERGDARGASDLAAWWGDGGSEAYVRATEILAALAKIHARAAVPALVRSLADIRLRPFVADALAEIGDPDAREPLAAVLATEAQVTSRAREARALARLGGASWAGASSPRVDATLPVPRALIGRGLRLVVLASGAAPCEIEVDGKAFGAAAEESVAPAFDLGLAARRSIALRVNDRAGIEALFLVAAPETPVDAGAR
jgi:HEAT repeat protein